MNQQKFPGHTNTAKATGQPPGALLHVGRKKLEKTAISIIDYNGKEFSEMKNVSPEEAATRRDNRKTVTWINIEGIHDTKAIERIGRKFGIPSLMLEDILNTGQRPKVEEYDDGILFVLKMIFAEEKTMEISVEQVSVILGKRFVISFHERESSYFDPIRERISNSSCKLRKSGPDFLAYSLIDIIVDDYFDVLEAFGERIERLEKELVDNPGPSTLRKLYHMKSAFILLRKSVWPLREVVNRLEKLDSAFLSNSLDPYLRDVYDHTIQVIETIETYRDMLTGMLDLYLSSVNNRMNEIMKVLTIIATLFMPLTFIVGLYGMNFEHLPEIRWKYGYLMVWSVIIVVAVSMITFFKRKKWF